MSSSSDPSLSVLMRAYVDGDERAFVVLHARLQPILRSRLKRLTRDNTQLDDIVQSAFLRAHVSRERFDLGSASDARVLAWYLAVVRTTAFDHLRNQIRRAKREAQLRPGDPHASPEELHVEAEQTDVALDRLRRALGCLRTTDRELVVQNKLRGRSLADLARAQGLRPVTVRVRAHRAYKRLCSALVALPAAA